MANKMKRSIKTNVRATDTELMTLHRIADENRTKLAEILRQSTLERDFSRFVNTSRYKETWRCHAEIWRCSE